MDPQSKEYLDKILAKDPDTLNEYEIKFLRARRDYLKKSQLDEYDSVINPKVKEAPVYVSKKDKNQTSEEEPVKEKGEP